MTAKVGVLALTGILLDGCHRGTQSSCNLTVEVSHKHVITHAQNHSHTRTHTGTKTNMYRLAQAPLQGLCECITYKNLYRNIYTLTH